MESLTVIPKVSVSYAMLFSWKLLKKWSIKLSSLIYAHVILHYSIRKKGNYLLLLCPDYVSALWWERLFSMGVNEGLWRRYRVSSWIAFPLYSSVQTPQCYFVMFHLVPQPEVISLSKDLPLYYNYSCTYFIFSIIFQASLCLIHPSQCVYE